MTTTTAVLTPRRREALTLAARGLSNAQIAKAMFVSTDTVKTMLSDAYSSLGALDRTNAVALALIHGVITRRDILGGAA